MDNLIESTPKANLVNQTNHEVELIEIQNQHTKLTVCPNFGGKIISIKSRTTDTEFLKQPFIDIRKITEPEYGMDFLPPYSFGFDECFPTVEPCSYHLLNGNKVSIPDHGEVWNRKWDVAKTRNSIEMNIRGIDLDYKLTKKISLHNHLILMTYELSNTGSQDFRYLWSTHPLLHIEENDEILLPKDVHEVEVYYSNNKQLIKGDKYQWASNLKHNLVSNIVQGVNSNFASKVFVKDPHTKKAGLYRRGEDQSIVFDFTYSGIEQLGIWMTYKGWPENSNNKDYTVALEPTTTSMDSLSEAIEQNDAKYIRAGESIDWSLKVLIENGRSEL
ncbi:MAG: hypothetical protein RI564_01670 [Gracilimonas sp.]|nr:hypothetical protein [Gracilimonas sp.]